RTDRTVNRFVNRTDRDVFNRFVNRTNQTLVNRTNNTFVNQTLVNRTNRTFLNQTLVNRTNRTVVNQNITRINKTVDPTTQVSAGTTYATPSGLTVEVGESLGLSESVSVSEDTLSLGNFANISGTAEGHVTLADLTGQIQLSDIDANQTDITINHSTEGKVTVGRRINSLTFDDETLLDGDGSIRFSYGGTTGYKSKVVFYDVAPNTEYTVRDASTGNVLDEATSDSDGVVVFDELDNSEHTAVASADNEPPQIDNASASPSGGSTVASDPVSLSVDVSDPNMANQSVNVSFFVNGAEVETKTVSSNGTVSASWSSPTDGSHSWHVEATDSAGASTTSETFSFAWDSTQSGGGDGADPPQIDNASASPTGTVGYGSSLDLSVDVSDPEFSTGDEVTVTFYVDGSQIGSKTVSSNGTVSGTWLDASTGNHSWHVEAEDSFGETATSESFSVDIVNHAPEVDNGSASPAGGSTVEDSLSVDLSVDVSDSDFSSGDSATVRFYVDGSQVDSVSTSSAGTVTGSWSSPFEGTHSWHAEVEDSAGASATSEMFNFEYQVNDDDSPLPGDGGGGNDGEDTTERETVSTINSSECSTETWTNGSFFEATTCPYRSTAGYRTTSAVLFLVVSGGLTVFSRSPVTGLTLGTLFSGVIGTVLLPAQAYSITGVMMLLGIALTGFRLWMRMRSV
ncbi:MAG: hypothetical protein SV253_01185, partial [Halobacteria archaeon]|nr:hypothetical protein [Halobacteria archaeon]